MHIGLNSLRITLECHNADCIVLLVVMQYVIMLSVVMLRAVAPNQNQWQSVDVNLCLVNVFRILFMKALSRKKLSKALFISKRARHIKTFHKILIKIQLKLKTFMFGKKLWDPREYFDVSIQFQFHFQWLKNKHF